MEPRERKERSAYPNGPKVSVASVDDDSNVIGQEFNLDNNDTYFEDGGLQFDDDEAPSTEDIENEKKEVEKMTDEEIKVKALGQAVNVAKLMSNVGVDDVIEIAKKLAKFIKG
jgi:hypothetical protein